MDPNQTIENLIFQQNNTGIAEFLGLTPEEMHNLLYETFSEKSPVQLQVDIEGTTLDKMPLFRIAEEYLKILQREKQIKLTPLGALPKKIIVELYEKRIIVDKLIESGLTKLSKEADCIAIQSVRISSEKSGLVRKANNKIMLTKAAVKLLETQNRNQIFKQLLQAFTQKFNWGYHDGYPDIPVGQLGWAFTVLLLTKFGDQPRTTSFYADYYEKAFPSLAHAFELENERPGKNLYRCYSLRVFERFMEWFGWISIDQKEFLLNLDKDTVTVSSWLNEIFTLKR